MQLAELTVRGFADLLGSDAPAPGGGSAAALAGALGAALTAMVGSLTVGRKKYAEFDGLARETLEKARDLEHRFLDVMERDTEAFNAVSAVFLLFSLMAVGYFLGVFGWMGSGEKKFLSRFVVNIAVPCNCLVGLLNNLKHEDLARAGQMMVFTVSSIVLTLALSALAATLLRLPRSRWGVFVPMAGLSNVLFVGLPLCTQLFGEVCVPYVMVYYLSNTIFTQSLAVVLIERAGSQPGKGGSLAHRMLDMLRKPPIVGMAVSIVLLVLGLRPPELVMRFASQISGSVTPLALIYCGYIVYEVGLKNLRFLQGMPTMLVIRLIVSPLICAAFCLLGGVSGLAMRVFIVESALPVVSQITVMAGAYGADEEYAATGACLSMLGCFFTIPVLMLILS